MINNKKKTQIILLTEVSRGPFLKSPGNVLARKAIFSSSVSGNGEVYML